MPEREMPGMSAAACAVPTAIAWRQLSFAMLARARRAAAEPLEDQEQKAVDDQECRGSGCRCEHAAQLVLEQQAEDPGRDRADHEQPAEPRVVVADLAVAQRAAEAAQNPHPVLEEEEEQDDGRGQVGGDQEREEELVVLVDVPAEEARHDHRVPEARDREGLGDALHQAEHGSLEVRNRVVVHCPSVLLELAAGDSGRGAFHQLAVDAARASLAAPPTAVRG
jgi:hypothetical protein